MNTEEKRFHAAVAAMQGLLAKTRPFSEDADEIPRLAVKFSDALLAELDRTKPEPKADADGWIPHRPGDPMPCDGSARVDVKHRDGVITEGCTAGFWSSEGDYDTDWWANKDCMRENVIIAWKPSGNS